MCNLLQLSQAALQADISDGDYRTYMILCTLAAENHHATGYFNIALTYAAIGQQHPKPLSTAGVRSRINRLVKAGLVTRERIDNRRWRTIPVGDSNGLISSSTVCKEAIPVVPHNTQPVDALPTATPSAPSGAVHNTQAAQPLPAATLKSESDVTYHTQRVATDNTETASALPASRPTVPTAATENTQSLVGAATKRTQPTVNETAHGTQVSLTITTDETQNDVHVLFQGEQILVFDGEMNPLGRKQGGFIDTEPIPRPEEGSHGGKAFMNRSLARRVLVRTAIEAADVFLNGEPVNGVGVASENAPSMINDHDLDDLNNSSINDHDQEGSNSNMTSVQDDDDGLTKEGALATVLANLPQPMSPDGIVECVTDPELCAAWLDYATNPDAGVRNPAAYVRKGVRSGAYPPPIAKTYISPNSPIYRPSYTEIVQSKPSAL